MQKIRNHQCLGYNIFNLRKSRGLKQVQVVAKMQLLGSNISRTSYSKIERGIRNISTEELIMLQRILNVDYNAFFHGIDL